MKHVTLADLIIYAGNVASYLERLLYEEGAIAIQLSDEETLELWTYYDVYEHAPHIEEALEEFIEEHVYFVSLENLWLMAETSKKTDPERRPMRDHLISMAEALMNAYDYVIIHDGEWEMTLHGYLAEEQAEAILERAGLI